MAGEIFVGSVAVGVVPDLRGFNDRMRVELVPAANRIGQEMGREMSRGIMDGLDIGRIVSESTIKAQVVARKSGYDLGMSYGRAFRRGFDLALEGWKPRVTVQVDADTLAARAAIDRLGGTVTERVRTTGGGAKTAESVVERVISGGSSRGGGGDNNDPGVIGGISALIRALPGGTSGSIGAVPASVGVPAAIAGAVALPFIGQMLAGAVPAVLGGGLAAMGIAGAVGAGRTSSAQTNVAHQALLAANARVIADQARLNTLNEKGKATTDQLTSAESALASARSTQTKAQQKYQDLRKTQMTSAQEEIRAQVANLGINALLGLQKIGLSFVPVVEDALVQAEDVLGKLIPVFSTAVSTIAGPFQVFADALIQSFGSPQVASSIQAVAEAFGQVMLAFAPDIPGIVNSFADAIERIANSVKKNPKAFADFLNFFFQIVIVVLDGIAALSFFADYVEQHFIPFFKHIGHFFVGIGHDIEHVWDLLWTNLVVRTEHGMHDVASAFDRGRHSTASIWNIIYRDTIGKVVQLFNDIKHFVTSSFDTWWASNGEAIKAIWRGIWRSLIYTFHQIFDPIVLLVGAIWKGIKWEFTNGGQQVSQYWHNVWNRVMTIIRFFANELKPVIHGFWVAIVNEFKISADIVKSIWHAFWNNIIQLVKIAWATIKFVTKTSWDIIVGIFTIAINILTGHWRTAWKALENMVIQVWNNLKSFWSSTLHSIYSIFSGWYGAFRSLVINSFKDAANWLVNAGGGIIRGLMNGIKSAVVGIGSWIKGNVVDPIINAVKHFFGIQSPATSMIPLGVSLIRGLIKGMLTSGSDLGKFMKTIFGGWPEALGHLIEKSFISVINLPSKAIHALGGVAGKVGGFVSNLFKGGPAGAGVERWLNIAKIALMLNNLPDSLAGQVLFQMRTESGGNPNAINMWDINAQRGDPSRGLMQVIGSTFSAYHVPGTSSNIYDPLANIAAAINYAKHVYGPNLMRGSMGMGSGHGYDQGGWLPTGASIAYNLTGKPELVLTHEQMQGIARGGDGGTQYIAHFDSLTGASIESHVRTAFQAMSITQGNLNRQGRRR